MINIQIYQLGHLFLTLIDCKPLEGTIIVK